MPVFLLLLLFGWSGTILAQPPGDSVVTAALDRLERLGAHADFAAESEAALDLIQLANNKGNFGLADSLALTYAARADSVPDVRVRMELYHEAGKSAFFVQQYDASIRYDTAALAELPGIEPANLRDSFAVEIRNYLGKAYNAGGRFVDAALVLTDAIDLWRATRTDTNRLLEMYTELGIVYSQIGLYDRAVEYLDYGIRSGGSVTPITRASGLINIGRNLLLQRDYAAAADRFHRTLAVSLPAEQQILVQPYAYNGLVEAHYRMGNQDSVRHYYKKYGELLVGHQRGEAVNGFLYRQSTWLNQLVTGQLAEAERTGRALYREAREKKDPAEELMYLEFLADTYRLRGDYREAADVTRRLMVRKDSIQSANRNDALLLYYEQFETEEKENEILRLDAARQEEIAERRLFQTAAGLLALLLLTGGFFYFQLRKARREVDRQNVALNRLNATKDRFFGIIAHDLRNPIAALQSSGYQIEALYRRQRPEQVRQVTATIAETARRLNGLLDNLLKWALGQSGTLTLRPRLIALSELVDDVFGLYRPAAEAKAIDFVLEVNPDDRVYADHDALHTILRNLVGNAVKFSPADHPGTISVTYRSGPNEDEIIVRDEGPGLSPAQLAGLFQLAETEGEPIRRGGGTGLGLILCKEMAELHGGELLVSSEEGQGTVVSLRLPRKG